MKKVYQRILQAMLCLALCILMLMGGFVSAGAAESTPPAAELLDYSLPALENKQSLSASEIFYRIYGSYPPPAEQAYLDQLSGITLRYTDLIPPSIVSAHYDGETGILDVTVPTYTYTASNGVLVEWVPEKATLEGVDRSFDQNGEEYTCRFEELFYSKDFDLHVTFRWLAEIPAEAVDQLLTKPSLEGMEALKIVEEYESAYLNPYLEMLKKYEVWAAYQQALKDHAQYLSDLAQYEKDLEIYKSYLIKYEQYLKDLASYEAYLQNKADWEHFFAYQVFLENDLENYNEYLLYQSKVNKVLSNLAILESLFTADSHNWTFYPSLMGNTVTSVISRKDELITAGCDANNIDTAEQATKELRSMLEEYAALRTAEYASEHDKTASLYAYYTAHYKELGKSFANLYGALGSLYENWFVYEKAKVEGKLERFQQFIGQLYVTATCLNDSDDEYGTRLENWELRMETQSEGRGLRLSEIVEPINLIEDNNDSDPKNALMPETEVERVEAVEPIEKPSVTLSPVPKPKEIPALKEPQAPAFVEAPDRDNPPPAAPHPGEVPPRPKMEEALWNLALALRDGSVPKRDAEGLSHSISLSKTVACPISIHNLKTVTFYDADGTTVLYQQMVNYGESVTYGGPSMSKTDPYYVYSFRGWVLFDGTPAKFDQVFENLSIFANYQVERRLYRIRWILDGVVNDTYYHYGELPKPPVPTEKPGGVDMMYQFTGWDKEIVSVTENATYTGGFELVPRTYAVTWVLGETELVEQVKHGTLPVFPGGDPSYSDGTYYYAFSGWDKDLSIPVTGERTYYAKYVKKDLATAGNGATLEVVNDGKSVTVLAGGSSVFIGNVAEYAVSQGLPLKIRWTHFEATYSTQALTTLISSACDKLALEQRTTAGGISYTVSYRNAAGEEMSIRPVAVLSLFAVNEDGPTRAYALWENDAWKSTDSLSHSVFGSFSLLVKEAFRVFVESNEFCNISALPLYAMPGDWISLDLACEFGYEVVGAEIFRNKGITSEHVGMKFQMPAEEITIRLKVEKIVYHVTFTVDGEIYSEADYFLGEEIKLPQNPQKAQDDTYSYTFYEWSPAVTIAIGEDRNPEYKAVFSKNLLNGKDPYLQGNNNKLLNTYLPIALGVILLAVGVLVFLRVRKKRRFAVANENAEHTEN